MSLDAAAAPAMARAPPPDRPWYAWQQRCRRVIAAIAHKLGDPVAPAINVDQRCKDHGCWPRNGAIAAGSAMSPLDPARRLPGDRLRAAGGARHLRLADAAATGRYAHGARDLSVESPGALAATVAIAGVDVERMCWAQRSPDGPAGPRRAARAAELSRIEEVAVVRRMIAGWCEHIRAHGRAERERS